MAVGSLLLHDNPGPMMDLGCERSQTFKFTKSARVRDREMHSTSLADEDGLVFHGVMQTLMGP